MNKELCKLKWINDFNEKYHCLKTKQQKEDFINSQIRMVSNCILHYIKQHNDPNVDYVYMNDGYFTGTEEWELFLSALSFLSESFKSFSEIHR